MSPKAKKIISVGCALALICVLIGCSNKTSDTTSNSDATSNTSADTSSSVTASGSASTASATVSSGDAIEACGIDIDDQFSDRDLAGSWDEDEAVTVSLSDSGSTANGDGVTIDGGIATITAEGTYVFSGSVTQGQIVVDVDDSAKVQIVLNGVTISNTTQAAIYVINADKTFITVADGTTNALSTSAAIAQEGDTAVDGTIFSHDDLVINGTGTLRVTSAVNHGVVSSDDLKLVGVSLSVDSTDQWLRANNSIRIASGVYTLTSEDDCVHADSSDDKTGYVYIENGTFVINAGDDGIHADGVMLICGGTIDVQQSYEGIEGQIIGIAGGDITVVSRDDGLNAASKSADATEMTDGMDRDSSWGIQQFGAMESDSSCILVISGGLLSVTADGDGLDSNGYLIVTGGTTYVYGPENDGNGPLDYGISATISGGTLLAAGSSGMAETFSTDSTQCSMMVGLSGSAGDTISVSDSDGTVLVSTTVEKAYACVIVSSPDMVQGETYTVSNGSTKSDVTLSSVSVTSGVSGGGMGGFGGGGGAQAPEWGGTTDSGTSDLSDFGGGGAQPGGGPGR